MRVFRETVSEALSNPVELQGAEYRFAARAGIALSPQDGSEADTLLKHAQAALNRAKATGDAYCFYEPEVHARIAGRLKLESELRRAVEHDELVLCYQPKFNTETLALTGLEALMRWVHPERGVVLPGEFMAVAEDTGLIREIGRRMRHRITLDACKWAAAGMIPTRIAVNLSAVELREPGLDEALGDAGRIIRQAGEGDGGLDIEVTESMLMDDFGSSVALLSTLRSRGVRVYIDDFGTGFSSLQYLAKLPIDALKIDRGFVKSMNESAEDHAIVSTVVSLARSLRIGVVAEGVETGEQYRALKALRCDEVQGFRFGRPIPASEVPAACIPWRGNAGVREHDARTTRR